MTNVVTVSPISLLSQYLKADLKPTDSKEQKANDVLINNSLKRIEVYVNGSSNKSALSMLVYRIWNAVKACFGQSDRQRAKRALKDVTILFCKENAIASFDAFVTKSTQKRLMKSGSDFVLDLLVGLNNNKAIQIAADAFQIRQIEETDENREELKAKTEELIKRLEGEECSKFMNSIGINKNESFTLDHVLKNTSKRIENVVGAISGGNQVGN